MSNKQVIPKVGQVWTCRVIGGDVDREISAITDRDEFWDVIHFKCGNHMSQADIGEGTMTFKPQDDLEWLAINCDEWNERWQFIYKTRGESVGFCGDKHDFGSEKYTRQQWQVKRNELFGVEIVSKPKMKAEYKQIEDSIFNLHVDFVSRELYYMDRYGNWQTIKTVVDLAVYLDANKVFRKVETPVTWQGELEDFIDRSTVISLSDTIGDALEIPATNSDSAWDVEFIKMCRLVVKHVGDKD